LTLVTGAQPAESIPGGEPGSLEPAVWNSAVNSAWLTRAKNTGDRLLSDVRAIPVAMIECVFRL
jgi:hypothetical protein